MTGLGEFLERAGHRRIVINTDIDGFLCGMLLQRHYGCEVVGFCNSRESIWLAPQAGSLLDQVYVDIFVGDPRVFCIDQHIVAYNRAHLERIVGWGTKMNPNLDLARRTFCGDLGPQADYYHKYPFGTVHYLMALMAREGIEPGLDLASEPRPVTGTGGHSGPIAPWWVILRADDAMNSSLGPYADNARRWWQVLGQMGSGALGRMVRLMYRCGPLQGAAIKAQLSQFFLGGLCCDGADGAFDGVADAGGRLQSRVIRYCKVIGDLVGMGLDLPGRLAEHRGRAQVGPCTRECLNGAFTYAFVRSPRRPDKCLSLTMGFK
ncbi:MAG: hypothetical protein K6A65_07995 [Succinivibrionaceae bacterium]|nr:hypothetical protein [Succinivibrionaceae bacterium]